MRINSPLMKQVEGQFKNIMSSQGIGKNENAEDMQSLLQMEQYFDFNSVRLRSFSNSNIQNLFLSLHSMGRRQSNRLDLLAPVNPSEGEDFRANHTREDLEIESGIILKRYGKVLKIFLRENSAICFLCKLNKELQSVSAEYQIIQTNLLRKYYPTSVRKITRKMQKLCKIMFYDLNKAIYKARNKDQFSQREEALDETPTEDFYSKRIAPLSKSEIYNFRKFLVDWDEIKFDEAKEYLFGYHTQGDYWSLFRTYYRINQFNLIRPKLHVNDVTKIQKTKYDLMWKLRQKILRHLVSQKSESFVLKINVSKLCEHKPERSHIKERVGEYLQRGLSNEILENIQQQSLLSMQRVEPFEAKEKVSPQLCLENLINNSILFQSQKEKLSFKNSFFSNMMSIRENDSMGGLVFGNEMNLSRRESSIRKDSYQMNKFGENRQSLDLFSIKKKIHEIRSERDLFGEMKKQSSIGNFNKKNRTEHIHLEVERDINLYAPESADFDMARVSSSFNQVNQNHFRDIQLDSAAKQVGEDASSKIKPLVFLDSEARKTHKDKNFKSPVIMNFFDKNDANLIQGPGEKSSLKDSALNESLKHLKEITSKQKKNPTPRLKDKLRHSKKTKKKINKMHFDNQEIQKEMKRFELETTGSKMVYESRPKVRMSAKGGNVASKQEQFKRSFKKGVKGKKSFGKKRETDGIIQEKDEEEFQQKINKQFLAQNKLKKDYFKNSDQNGKKDQSNKKQNEIEPKREKQEAEQDPNILRSSSANLLPANIVPTNGQEIRDSALGESKEVYTFGQVAEEEETPKDYNLPSPKLRPKKRGNKSPSKNNYKYFNIVNKDEAKENKKKRETGEKIPHPQKGHLTIVTKKNIFTDSFRTIPKGKGRDSQKDFSENTPLGSPHGLYINGLEDTFGDQSLPKEKHKNPGKRIISGEELGDQARALKTDGFREKSPFYNKKPGLSQGFLTQREKINKKFQSNNERRSNKIKQAPFSKKIIKASRIDMGKISSINQVPIKRKENYKGSSHSNSSEIMKNMTPAWNHMLPDSHGSQNMYHFKKKTSPQHNFFKKTPDIQKFQKIGVMNPKIKKFYKNNSHKIGDYKSEMKGPKQKNETLKKKPQSTRNPFTNISKKGFRLSNRIGSSNKIFKPKTGLSTQLKKKGNTPFKGVKNFEIRKKAVPRPIQKGSNKFGIQRKTTQKNSRKSWNDFKAEKKLKQIKKLDDFKIKKIQTEKSTFGKSGSKLNSKEINSNMFESDPDNRHGFKTARGTYNKKKQINQKVPKSLKKIPIKNIKKKHLSSSKESKFKNRGNLKYSTEKKGSSVYPSKGKNRNTKIFGTKGSKLSYTKPSIGSIKSLKSPSPINKGSGYFLNSLKFRNSSNPKSIKPKTLKFTKKNFKTKSNLKKVKKKINARREYFDADTLSIKTNSIRIGSSKKSVSIPKKIVKNRSRSNILKPTTSSLKKNYSKKNIKKPMLKRKPLLSKNLSIGTKFNSSISQSREKRPYYNMGKYFNRGGSLTTPFTQVSIKTSSKKGSMISNQRSPSNNSSMKKEKFRQSKDKSKVSSRAAATSRYTSKEKNHVPKSSKNVSRMAPDQKEKKPKRGLRMSYLKMEAGEKKKRKINRNKFVSYNEMYRIGMNKNH